MHEPAEEFDDDNDEVPSFADAIAKARAFLHAVWAGRRALLGTLAIGAMVGLFIGFASGEEYTAATRILPYRSGGGGASGLSGLAGLAGIRLPAGAADQTITADLYPEVARSQDFRIVVAETPLIFGAFEKRATVVEYFRDLRRPPPLELLAHYTIGLPGTLRALLPVQTSRRTMPTDSSDSSSRISVYDKAYLKLVNTLLKRLTVTIDKKTSVITITGKMPDAYAAADLVRVTSDQLMARIIDYESRKAGEQFRFVNEQYQQAKIRYERSQRELAVFADRNRVLMSATAQIDRERLQREYDLAYEVYQQFSRELEQARIKMHQDTPVFTVLDQISVPTERTSPRRMLLLIVSILIAGVIGIGRIGIRFFQGTATAPVTGDIPG